jgi:hypothetical protein
MRLPRGVYPERRRDSSPAAQNDTLSHCEEPKATKQSRWGQEDCHALVTIIGLYDLRNSSIASIMNALLSGACKFVFLHCTILNKLLLEQTAQIVVYVTLMPLECTWESGINKKA